MKLTCPSCKRIIPGEDINLKENIAVCRECSEVFSLPTADALGTSSLAHWDNQAPVVMPEGLRFSEWQEGGGFHFIYLPKRSFAMPVVIFATIWNGFLLFWLKSAFVLGLGPGRSMFWFSILHILVGIGLAYHGLCLLFNRVEVRLDKTMFSLSHRPIPRHRQIQLPINELIKFIASRREPPQPYSRGTHFSFNWSVGVLLAERQEKILPFPLRTQKEANFIAHRFDVALRKLRDPQSYRG